MRHLFFRKQDAEKHNTFLRVLCIKIALCERREQAKNRPETLKREQEKTTGRVLSILAWAVV